jgi:hypothetical protein
MATRKLGGERKMSQRQFEENCRQIKLVEAAVARGAKVCKCGEPEDGELGHFDHDTDGTRCNSCGRKQ